MKDSFYTPSDLARRLVGFIRKRNIHVVADFCVGDGELLRAAEAKWEAAEFIATDISDKALNKVRKQHPNWVVGKCDFQNQKSRNRCKALKGRLKKVDLILLNPPFSCIGGTRHHVQFNGDAYTSSTALAFVAESLPYLSDSGCIYAILPSSVAGSERDACLWNKLVEKYKLKILGESSDKHFVGCEPNILIVSLNSSAHQCTLKKPNSIVSNVVVLEIFRGRMQIDSLPNKSRKGFPLVHTTNLQDNTITKLDTKFKASNSLVSGPAVLLPRVGNPSKQKICLLPQGRTVLLSDCVIALKTRTSTDAKTLQNLIVANWESFSALYRGTGAKYITINRIKSILGIK